MMTEPPLHKSTFKKSFVTTVETPKENDQEESKVAFHKPCLFCAHDHTMDSCVKMSNKLHKDKIEFLRTNGLCFACLKRGHLTKACKRHLTSQICSKKHPTVLHIRNTSSSLGGDLPCPQTNVHKKPCYTGCTADCKLAIIPVKVKAAKGSRVSQTYAFLDPGSSATFCKEKLMRRLNLNGKRIEILLKTMGQEKPVKTFRLSGLEVSKLNRDYFIELPETFTQSSIALSQENIPHEEDIRRWPYLKDVRLHSIEADVDLLIGINVPKVMEPLRVINSQKDGPYAVQII